MIPPDRVPLERGQPALLVLETDEPRCQSWIAEQNGGLVWLETTADAASDLRLHVGDEVLVRTWRATDALYVLRGRVEQVQRGARLRVGLRLLAATRQQQRQYFRVPLDVPAEAARCLDDTSGEPLQVHVRDLSANGIGLLTSVPLWVGAQLALRVRLPGGLGPLDLRARGPGGRAPARAAGPVAERRYAGGPAARNAGAAHPLRHPGAAGMAAARPAVSRSGFSGGRPTCLGRGPAAAAPRSSGRCTPAAWAARRPP